LAAATGSVSYAANVASRVARIRAYRWLKNKNYGIRIGFIDETHSQCRNYPLAEQLQVW